MVAAGKRHRADHELAQAIAGRVALPDPAIEAWRARLDLTADQVERCANLLARDERERADRFHSEGDRRHFIVARGILRALLARQLNVPATSLAFGYTGNGKPFIDGYSPPVYFNLSHSQERALFAISRERVVGVDIECVVRDVDCMSLAQRFFTRSECTALRNIPEDNRKRAFFACWTRKEAVIKATGDGLSLALDQFEVTVDPDAMPRMLAFAAAARRGANWQLYTADAGNDYFAAVAAYDPRS